jgi:magnesium-transporting ATPase (P-type)
MVFKGCSIYTKLFDSTVSNKGKIKEQRKKYMPLPSGLRTVLSSTERISTIRGNKTKNEKATSYVGTATSFNTGFTEDEIVNRNSKITPNFCFDYFYKCLYDREAKITLELKNGEKAPLMTQHEVMEQFLFNIVTNHDVLVEKRTEKNDVIYQGISPDEVTLVSMADELGYTFLSRENEKIIIEIYDYEKEEKELREFQILKKFDFTSERQSSGIIVRDLKTNKIYFYIKGSDRKIIQGIDSFSKRNILGPTQEHVDQFAHQGLRTLCYSFKILEESEYNNWLKDYEEMKYKATKDKTLNAEVEKLIDKIESNSLLLGATALEDKLQQRVKRDIEDFIEADINFWMITGDKMDTAETIGYSCGIISEDSEVFKIRENKDPTQVKEQLEKIKKSIGKSNQELENIIYHHNKKLEKLKNNENNINQGDNIIVPNIIGDNEQNYHDTNKNANELLNIKNSINNPELNENNKNAQLIYQKPIIQQNANYIYSKIPLDTKINEKNNNLNNWDKKTEMSNNASENSASPSEIIEYLTKLDNDNNNNENNYLDEVSIIQKKLNNNNDNSTIKMNIKKENKEKNKSLFSKNQNELNSNRKEYIKAYDYFQNKLNEYSHKTKSRCFLFKMKYIYPQPDKIYTKNEKITSKYTLIIEGSAINTCIDNEDVSKIFYELIKDSRSLICCRTSPSQKSKIVKFIKKNSDELTLAIGDGGNDVNMIKAAHVGIGIFGKEGYQAAYNSDYAISQFKYLKRLLFVDGRFSLARNSYFIYHYFFKNVVYSMVLFWFQIFNKFSGRSLMDDWYATSFNSFFTVVPIAVRAAIEEDFDPDFTHYSKSERKKLPYLFPDIYKEFRESKPFNVIKFIFIYMIAFSIAILFFVIPAFSYYEGTYGTRGIVYSFWDVSWSFLFAIILTHFAMVFEDTFLYNKFNIFWYILQIITNVIVLVTLNSINLELGMDDTLWFIMGNLNFWFTLVLLFSIIFIPFFILRNAEFFFGGFIVPMILQNKIENIYLIKYCQKKVDEMTRTNRRLAKFMKLYKNPEEAKKVDNYADKIMKEIVESFHVYRKKTKKRNIQKSNVNLENNSNTNDI